MGGRIRYRLPQRRPADGADLVDGFHRLWWTRMSTFWQLVDHYDRGDHSCDDLFISGEELLHWWTRHSTEVHDAVAGRA